MREYDKKYLRVSLTVAQKARSHGNHPFGALLVDENGLLILEAENTVISTQDVTAHAETNLVRQASRQYPADFLSRCTLYASTEPCPMCAGAIYWSDIRRVVYGLGQAGLYALVGEASADRLLLPCRQVFAQGGKSIEVIGPLLEEEALQVHIGFWTKAG